MAGGGGGAGKDVDGAAQVEDAAMVAPIDLAPAPPTDPAPPIDAAPAPPIDAALPIDADASDPDVAVLPVDAPSVFAVDAPTNNPPVDAKAPAPDAASTGLEGAYYDGDAFDSLKLMRVDPTVDFAWNNVAPDPELTFTGFTVRWTGKLRPLYSETYTFTIHSGDGARLWVNGTLVIDDWKLQAPQDESGTIKLTANQLYDIKIEYMHQTGYSVVRLLWQSPSQARVVVPSANLLPH
jgi:hypothetical protein